MRQSGTAFFAVWVWVPFCSTGSCLALQCLGAALAAEEEAVPEGQGTGEVRDETSSSSPRAALLPRASLNMGSYTNIPSASSVSKVELELLGKC